MKTQLIAIVFFCAILKVGLCQEEVPCYALFPLPETFHMYKEDSTGFWFTPKTDTSILGFISLDKRVYRHFDKATMRLLVEGDFGGRIYTDAFMRFGKWTEYYKTGYTKTVGYYYENQPIGQWQFYFENGQLKETYSISLIEAKPSSSYCRTGLYQAFYSNGQLKVNGFYKTAVDSTTEEHFNYQTNQMYTAPVVKPVSKPFGIWTYYDETGRVINREEFEEYINPFLWFERQ